MGGEVAPLPMQENHSDCSRVAQHALVLGPSGHVQPNPIVPAQPADSTIQSDSSQESVKPESPRVTPRTSATKEQEFFEAVLAEIEAPQESQPDQCMRQVDHFTKWCQSNQVDFQGTPYKVHSRLPPLFQDRKPQPSIINGHRSAIAHNWEIYPLMSAR